VSDNQGNNSALLIGTGITLATAAVVFLAAPPAPDLPLIVFGDTNAPKALEWVQSNQTSGSLTFIVESSTNAQRPVWREKARHTANVTNAARVRFGFQPTNDIEVFRVGVRR
jgi:hypothetical protein